MVRGPVAGHVHFCLLTSAAHGEVCLLKSRDAEQAPESVGITGTRTPTLERIPAQFYGISASPARDITCNAAAV